MSTSFLSAGINKNQREIISRHLESRRQQPREDQQKLDAEMNGQIKSLRPALWLVAERTRQDRPFFFWLGAFFWAYLLIRWALDGLIWAWHFFA